MDFEHLMQKKLTPKYKPVVKNKGDASNYSTYPDSTELPKAIKPTDDPFSAW